MFQLLQTCQHTWVRHCGPEVQYRAKSHAQKAAIGSGDHSGKSRGLGVMDHWSGRWGYPMGAAVADHLSPDTRKIIDWCAHRCYNMYGTLRWKTKRLQKCRTIEVAASSGEPSLHRSLMQARLPSGQPERPRWASSFFAPANSIGYKNAGWHLYILHMTREV
jgi:hypothetical protein